MEAFPGAGKLLMLLGALLILLGALLTSGSSLPGVLGWLGRLPGDIRIEGRGGVFYLPLASCLVLSAALSLFFWLFKR